MDRRGFRSARGGKPKRGREAGRGIKEVKTTPIEKNLCLCTTDAPRLKLFHTRRTVTMELVKHSKGTLRRLRVERSQRVGKSKAPVGHGKLGCSG